MPELPEVETIRRTLEQLVKGKTIVEIEVLWPKIIKHPDDTQQFCFLLKGQTIRKINRKGKYLLFYLDHNVLISHLRMEGKYALYEKNEPIDKHTHVIFTFDDGKQLRYRDVRKFGTMHVYSIGTEFEQMPLVQLGPEPFSSEFTYQYLQNALKKTTRTIKATLLDQTVVTGLGNIYVDEALFRASIHPARISQELSQAEIKRLHKEIICTLQEAVDKGGTTIRSYVDSLGKSGLFQLELFVYGREGEECRKCGTIIEKIKLNGRGTHFCRECQK